MTEPNDHLNDERDWRDAQPIRDVLDDSAERLPDETQAQLREARQRAVEAASQTQRPARRLSPSWYGLAASVVLAAMVALLWPEGAPQEQSEAELLFAMAELEDEEWAVVEDLEFAYWLSEQNHEALDEAERSGHRSG